MERENKTDMDIFRRIFGLITKWFHLLRLSSNLFLPPEKRQRKKIDEIQWKDKFGNPLFIERRGNEFVKITRTNQRSDFMFLGDVYSYDILSKNTGIKTYYNEYHNKAFLQRDIYGRLILYFYDEEMCFDGPDRKDLLWLFVKDEADADEMSKVGKLLRLCKPYIAGNETDWMVAHQFVVTEAVIDVGSKNPFPSNALSNLYLSEFTFDGARLKSMESFLQSLKTPDRKLQKKIWQLHGGKAKRAGEALKYTFDGKHLTWKGKTIDRFSDGYMQLLRQAYHAKFEQDALFRFALEATGKKPLVHSIGKQNPEETILTEAEFISLLEELRMLL
ncbi:MAG: hypothetical protein LBK97_08135 [Prevotellaceae bacterium]|jgi:predicted NAD-dependent protein-ADP-ribosyltransferase YbiA (DUF1768 family)|nr:hypothetical protein [Prevotellaceae bacterium]